MRRALWTSLVLVVLVSVACSGAWALERQLAGVRLGERAVRLLDRAGFGQPDFIGPLGTVGAAAPQAGAATAAGRAAPTGPTGARAGTRAAAGGMRGGMMGGAMRGGMGMGGARMGSTALPDGTPEMALTGMTAGGVRGGMGGTGMRGGGMMGGGMRAGAGAAGMRGGMMGVGRAGAGVPGGAAAQPRATSEGTGMYWYYRRSGGAVLVLQLNAAGEVRTITLSGRAPYAPGRTSRGIGLASHYMDLIGRYGYPDETVASGDAIQLTYVDHGVRFTLTGMRVNRIAIGADIVRAVEGAPATTPVAPAPPPAGMTPEELRGYL